MKKNRKVLVIGWDAAEWKIINELIPKGLMPTLEKFLKEGSSGKFATLDPPLSPILWTSMATGFRADVHGITGFMEPDPNPDSETGIRPVSVTSRKVKAVWNILNQNDYTTNVVCWWPSHPAEPVNGVMVSNFYQLEKGKSEGEWPIVNGTVHPAELSEVFKDLRLSLSELTGAHVLPFLPDLKNINQQEEKPVAFVVNTLAQTATVHNAVTWLMENKPADFTAVYYDGIDHFSHGCMKFHPPKMDHIEEEQYEKYKHVITSAYRFHDMMLERLLALTDDETTVIICSDHGFHSDHLRPVSFPNEPSGPTYEHSPYGFFAIKGPGIKKGETIYGASVIDLCPTILSLYDLPVGRDMCGRVLLQIYEVPPVINYTDSWENMNEGYTGQHPKDLIIDVYAEQAAMEQLVQLGYIETPSGDKATNIRKVIEESDYMLARNYMDKGEFNAAIPLLENLSVSNNYEPRFATRLFNSYLASGKFSKAKELISAQKEKTNAYSPYIELSEGMLLMAMNNPALAIPKFKNLLANSTPTADLYTQLGNAYFALEIYNEALEMYEKAIEKDPDNPYSLLGAGAIHQRQQNFEAALEYFFRIIEVIYFFPKAHIRIAECLYAMNRFGESAQAYEIALGMTPLDSRTRKRLATLYKEKLDIPKASEFHLHIRNQAIRGEVYIVTGVHCSGVELVMSQLEAAGAPLYYEFKESPDPAYPFYGYGHNLVFQLESNKKFIADAINHYIHIPVSQLMHLPGSFHYKVIVLERDRHEIMKEMQLKMKPGKTPSFSIEISEELDTMNRRLKSFLEELDENDIMRISYPDLLLNSDQQIHKILTFSNVLDHRFH